MSDLIVSRLVQHGGAARRAFLVRRRADAYRLGDAVGDGLVRQVGRGVFALPGAPQEVVAAVVHSARLGCLSTLSRAGIAVLRPPAVPHLSVGRERGRRPSGLRDRFPVVIHRERAEPDGPWTVSVAAALARVLLCRPGVEALVSVDSALNRRCVTLDGIRAALPDDAPFASLALDLADSASRSPLETVARLALVSQGLAVRAGVVVPLVGEVDLVVEDRIVIELDGYAYHSDRAAFEEDRRRDRELVLQGYTVLRFTAREVLHETARIVATVRAVLAGTLRPIPPHVVPMGRR
ncbi:MAG TPA: DUF559 domain-containing protein [Propionicimonas sp.]